MILWRLLGARLPALATRASARTLSVSKAALYTTLLLFDPQRTQGEDRM